MERTKSFVPVSFMLWQILEWALIDQCFRTFRIGKHFHLLMSNSSSRFFTNSPTSAPDFFTLNNCCGNATCTFPLPGTVTTMRCGCNMFSSSKSLCSSVSCLGESHESRGGLEVAQVTKRPGRHKIYWYSCQWQFRPPRIHFVERGYGFFLDGPIRFLCKKWIEEINDDQWRNREWCHVFVRPELY